MIIIIVFKTANVHKFSHIQVILFFFVMKCHRIFPQIKIFLIVFISGILFIFVFCMIYFCFWYK